MTPVPPSTLGEDRFAAASGIEIVEVRPGYARTRMPIEARHHNSLGLVHGGAQFTLAATAFFSACNAGGWQAVGITMQLSCLEPIAEGTLWAEAVEVARSRKLVTCTVRVTDENERLISLFQGTAYVKGPSRPGPQPEAS